MLLSQSAVDDDQSTTYFYLATDKNRGVYTLPSNTSAEVINYLAKKPTYAVSNDGTQAPLIQDDIKNIQLNTRLSEKDSRSMKLDGLATGDTHYYFQQTRCNGVPVFSSFMNIHVNADNEIYSLDGALAKADAQCERKISRSDAENIARDQFKKDAGSEATSVVQSGESVFSPKLSYQVDSGLYLSQQVELCGDTMCRQYFVDLRSGKVLYSIQTSMDAMNRSVSLKNGSSPRTEGSAAVADDRVNKVYDIMGEVYNFYFSNFQRDSYDGNGSLLRAIVDPACPGVTTHWNGSQMLICTTTIGLDVVTHEMQHGVTGNLAYEYESGALNESLSDIFGAAADSGDWEMGEETEIHAIRSLKDPTRFRDPDNVYSQHYYCGTEQNTLVHTNSGVFNKAYYLMSDGDTFPAQNGCTTTGIGRTKAVKIIYKALTTYIRGNSRATFKDMYNAVNSACNDLHQSSSAECQSVKIAMEAVGMDKPSGVGCQGTTQEAMTCAGTQAPSQGPSNPANPTATPSAQPTVTVAPTAAPTAIPTPSSTTKANAPLLSPWSLPQILAGTVKITQSGTNYTLRATLEPKTLTGLTGNQLKNYADEGAQGRLIGSKTLKTGAFKVVGDTVINEFTTTEDISQYSVYEVYFPGDGVLSDLSYLYADITGPISQGSAQEDKVSLTMKLRFQGIEDRPKATEAQLVRIGIGGGDLKETVYKQVVFTPKGSGVWEGNAIFDIPESTHYKILVKGHNHRQKKYCENMPTEEKPGEYICEADAISLKNGINTLDFSKVMQMAGDLNQDGIVNSQDMLFIRNNVGTQDIEKLVIGDVNKDGLINAVDHALTKFTLLSNRRDGN